MNTAAPLRRLPNHQPTRTRPAMFAVEHEPAGSSIGGQFKPQDGSNEGDKKEGDKDKPKKDESQKPKKAEDATQFKPTEGDEVIYADEHGAPRRGTVKEFIDKALGSGETVRSAVVTTDIGGERYTNPAHLYDPAGGPVVSDGSKMTLTPEEASAALNYIGSGHSRLNELLRGSDVLVQGVNQATWLETTPEHVVDLWRGKVETLDNAIERNLLGGDDTVHIPLDSTPVWRGATVENFGLDDLDNLEIGTEIGNHGFVSTSRDQSVAEEFVRGQVNRGNDALLVRVNLSANSRGLDFDGFTSLSREKEVLLARASKFKVTGIDRSGKIPVVSVDHIDPHDSQERRPIGFRAERLTTSRQ